MPLPLLFIGAAALTGAVGIGKTVKAGVDNSHAKDINADAEKIIDAAKGRIETARDRCGKSLEYLGEEKAFILNGSIKEFLDSFEKIKNVELEGITVDDFGNLKIDKAEFDELRDMSGFAASLLGGSAAGAIGGALTAFGAYGAATALASASTGTAIATLSGAAATNATLAFFGGGSLAAGGLGVAGGTAVLGGLVAGPALLVLGFVTGAKAKTNLENAYSNLAKAREIATELDTGAFQCAAIRRRAYMFYSILARLDSYLYPLCCEMNTIIEKNGVDFSTYSDEEKSTVAKAASCAQSVKATLDVALLSEEGELTIESKDYIDRMISDDEE